MTIVYIFLGLIGLAIVLDVAISLFMVLTNFTRHRHPDYAIHPEASKSPEWNDYLTKSHEGYLYMLSIPNEDWEIVSYDGLKLYAHFIPAGLPTKNTVLCIHGFGSTGLADHGKSIRFLHEQGYNILLPDDRAHGRSEGTYIGFGYLDRFDAVKWCQLLEEKLGNDCKTILYGISMGGATVVSASGTEGLPDSVCGVIDDCGYSSGWDENVFQLKTIYHLPVHPLLDTADLWFRLFNGYSLKKNTAKDLLKNCKVPTLFIHGGADDFVPTDMSRELYEAADCPKRLLIIDGAKHAQSPLVDGEKYYSAVQEFASGCFTGNTEREIL